jgi:hypothetical protein
MRPRWLRRPASRLRRLLARLSALLGLRRRGVRRAALAVALLAVLIIPIPVLASDVPQRQPACQGADCHARTASAERWAVPLSGTGAWSAGSNGDGGTVGSSGDGGTVSAIGQAYLAVGGGLAVVAAGLEVTGYRLSDGKLLWQVPVDAPLGAAIISVRAWPGAVTVGLLAPSGRSRSEVVIDAATHAVGRHYPSAVFGGAVSASAATTVVVGNTSVTSYDNATGKVRWRHPADGGGSWQVDGKTLYLAQSAGGALSTSPVTALKVIDLGSGAEGTLSSPLGSPFSGSLAVAADGAVLFASSAGMTAYSGSTGGELWSLGGTVAEGTDPATGLVYLTAADGGLRGVDPLTGLARVSVPASAVAAPGKVFVVRDGVAFGLDPGAAGSAWGYSVSAGRIAWSSAALPWPRFFSDVSGLGGSAAVSDGTVVVTACPHLAASPLLCADPQLVAFSL